MRILVLVPSIDLSMTSIGMTPVWWQLLKALHEIGNEISVIPYFTRGTQTLWWKCYEQPSGFMISSYRVLESLITTLSFSRDVYEFRSRNQKILLWGIRKLLYPKLKNYVQRVLSDEKGFDIFLVLSVPLNHIKGLARDVKQMYGIPAIYYDGDAPFSLPRYGGLSHSFYVGGDISEYDAVFVTSKGVVDDIKEMGAEKVFPIAEGADPGVFSPIELSKSIDVFFFGIGEKFREDAIRQLISIPSDKLQERKFAVGGRMKYKTYGHALNLGMVPYRHYSCASKINLNIFRTPMTEVYCSSSARLFELASMACCIVSNPAKGLEEWFEINKEVFVASDSEEAIELYTWLLSSEDVRFNAGRRARERVIKEHTYKHRAEYMINVLKQLVRKGG
ncbi:glycosyltransferase [Candidatus Bathyarchaeota archaeon]|nr:glycosyltransferase [Candidatus Bathyarchaeota archaeon]